MRRHPTTTHPRTILLAAMIGLCLIATIAVDAAPKAKQGFRKVLVHHGNRTSAPDQLLVGIDGEVAQRYQSYTVVTVNEHALAAFAKRAELQEVEIDPATHFDEIYLPFGVTDARRGTAGSHPGRALRGPYAPNRTGLYVVQFIGPILPQWQEEIAGAGAKVIVYVQFNSLVIAANETAAARIGSLPQVQYFDLFQPFVKYARARKIRGVERDYVIHLADAPGLDEDIRRIHAWSGGQSKGTRPGIANELRMDVRLDGSNIDAVLDLPLVIGVSEPIHVKTSDARVAASAAGLIMPVSHQPRRIPSYNAWLAETCPYCTNLHGENFFAGIADTGLNGGSAPGSIHHPDLPYSRTLWGANYIPTTDQYYSATQADRYGHGSAVAGVIAGNPASGAAADAEGFQYGTGIAPSAGIFVTTVDTGVEFTSPRLSVADAANHDVYVQNHSYNRYTYPVDADDCDNFYDGRYESLSQEFDQAVIDEKVTVIASAGNRDQQPTRPEGCGEEWVRLLTLPPGTAKNVISVGGAENVRPGNWNCHGSASENFNNLMENTKRSSIYSGQASFSAKWYIKPELFAPASNVALHKSTANPNANFCSGNTLPASYAIETGTSFAAPAVAGAAVLASRRYAETAKVDGVPRPNSARPSLIKAMLVAGARSMYTVDNRDGGYDRPDDSRLDPSPNSRGGFGRLTLDEVLSAYPARVYINETASIASTGAVWTQTFKIHDPSLPVKVAVAWTDPAGMPTNDRGTPVINDLDLVVDRGSPCNTRHVGNLTLWHGQHHDEVSHSGTCTYIAADHANNVELVKFYPWPGETQFTVMVRATTGVMTSGNPQRFSAVVYNAGNLTDTFPPLTPASLTAIASYAGTWSAALSWPAVTGATSYEVYASSNGSSFTSVGTPTTSSFSHNGLTPDRTYLYKVRAVNSAGKSHFSAIDPATTVQFTDGGLTGILVKPEHVRELRRAVNAFRAAAMMPAYAYTDPTLVEMQTLIRAAHVTDLRVALDSARDALGLPGVYLTGTINLELTEISAVQFDELRALVK